MTQTELLFMCILAAAFVNVGFFWASFIVIHNMLKKKKKSYTLTQAHDLNATLQ